MFHRKVVTASAAALAVFALSVPAVNAQEDDDPAGAVDLGSLSLASLDGGSSEGGSLTGGSADDAADDGADDGAGGGEDPTGDEAGSGSLGEGSLGEGSLGSLDPGSAEDTSLGDLTPETDEVCELPALGGSVAKFYPLFGIDGVPTGVLDLVTSALDSFPNLLDVVAGEGGGAEIIGQTGSFGEGLCTSIFGGDMVLPPVTVIVDEDGNPVSTVTGTPVSEATGTAATSATASGDSTAAGTTDSSATTDPSPSGDTGSTGAGERSGTGASALPTTVPVPGA